MHARQIPTGRVLGVLLAAAILLAVSGCAFPPALTKAELDSGKFSDKHPKLSAEKQKAGCRSCHREQEAVKAQ